MKAKIRKPPEVRQLPEQALPPGFRYEPMKPLTRTEAAAIARIHWHASTSADYDQTASATESAARLLVIKAKNHRMIAAELRRLKR